MSEINIGKAISKAMEEREMSTRQLAEKMSISVRRAGILRNSMAVNTTTVTRLCRAFDMSWAEFTELGVE